MGCRNILCRIYLTFCLSQSAAAKLMNMSSKKCHVTQMLISLHCLPIKLRMYCKVLMITVRALHGQTYYGLVKLIWLMCQHTVALLHIQQKQSHSFGLVSHQQVVYSGFIRFFVLNIWLLQRETRLRNVRLNQNSKDAVKTKTMS